MSETKGMTICPIRGKACAENKAEVHHLSYVFMLVNRYYIGSSLGEGGFGITYIGFDVKLRHKVAI